MSRDTKFPIEAYTMVFDYLKNISSLSTASILLLVAFMEKLFVSPEWKVCVGISLICFIVSVVFVIVGQFGVIEHIDKTEGIATWAGPVAGIGISMAIISFVIGLVSLSVFALKNFY